MTFDEWASQRLPATLRFATALCGATQLAEDVVQEALLKAHVRWDRIQAADSPEANLRRMIVNEFLSWRRKWARIIPRADVGAVWVAGEQRMRTEDDIRAAMVDHQGFVVVLSSGPDLFADPGSELVRIANGLELASDLKDQSTWSDATVAIP